MYERFCNRYDVSLLRFGEPYSAKWHNLRVNPTLWYIIIITPVVTRGRIDYEKLFHVAA